MSAVLQSDDPAFYLVRARNKAMTDPVWFAENILQLRALTGESTLDEDPDTSWELDQWTKDLLNAAADVVRKRKGLPTVINHKAKNQISVRSMHGPGKTFGLACLMHWFGFCFNSKIPCTAPKLQQLKTRLWPEFRKIRNRAIPGYKDIMQVDMTAISWIDKNGAFEEGPRAWMETASQPDNLSGLHHSYMMILVDEASGVAEQFYPVLEGAMSVGVILILVLISNPTRTKGTFADSQLKAHVREDWFPMHIRLQDTRRVSRDWVRKMETKYGKTSPVVSVRCYGEFASEDVNQLISLEWIAECRNRSTDSDGSLPKKRISVDVADGGTAFSVLTFGILYDSFMLFRKQLQFSFSSGETTRALQVEVEKLWASFGMDAANGDDIVVDSMGAGSGLATNLSDKYPTIAYKGGAASDNQKLYRCRRVQSYLVCRDWHRDGKIAYHEEFVNDEEEWDDVEGQLTSIMRKPGMDRIEDLTTKDELVQLHGPDTCYDRADSIAMMFATQSPTGSVGIIIPGQPTEASRYDAGLS